MQAAFLRQDTVSLNHRAAAWLSSYFDILFALITSANGFESKIAADSREVCLHQGSKVKFMATALVLQPRHAARILLQIQVAQEQRFVLPKLAFDECRSRSAPLVASLR